MAVDFDTCYELAPEGCWLWTKYRYSNGYGRYSDRPGKFALAHRISYARSNGPIPRGLLVCHHCDVRHCVNPAHLFLGTQAENIADARAKRRLRGMVDVEVEKEAARLFLSGLSAQEAADHLGISQASVVRYVQTHAPGNYRLGERKSTAGTTEETVREIRRRYASGGISQKALGAQYGLSQNATNSIIRGLTWSHVD